jgi:DNA-binding transcriptional regulator GbsR (MarR family)
MKHWQKLILDPAHYAVLKNTEEPKTKKEVADKTGLKASRTTRILQNLEKENLVKEEVENGVRKFQRKETTQKFEELKQELEKNTISGIKNLIADKKFGEARQHLSSELPVEGDTRVKLAKIEAAEKLESLI